MSEEKKSVEVRRSLRSRKTGEPSAPLEKDSTAEEESQSEEPFSASEEEEDVFGPEALGLTRVGTVPKKKKKVDGPAMNNRGRPARMRKKNPIFDNEDVVTDKKQMKQPPTPKKASATPASASKAPSKLKTKIKREATDDADEEPQPVKKVKRGNNKKKVEEDDGDEGVLVTPVDKRLGQKIGNRLRNLLKLPKAHKFVSYEWFYSTIDKAILDGENDFQQCLKTQFPTLLTRSLTRTEWNRIRSHMGKPRRCSAAFFEEERRELERRRQKIRLLQSRKAGDPSFIRDLPCEIPLPLNVGAKVTARLRSPQDGFFTGTVEAIDPIRNSYKIHFDRSGLGSYSVPDYEVCATEAPDTLNLATITTNFKPRTDVALYMISPLHKQGPYTSLGGGSGVGPGVDPLLGGDSYPQLPKKRQPLTLPKDQLNGYSVKLLETIVRMKKLLNVKQSKLSAFKKMNLEAEVQKSKVEVLDEEFQKKYAYHVVGMEKLNHDILDHLSQLLTFSKELSADPNVLATLVPSYMREKCRELAVQMVDKNNTDVHNGRMLKLITNLTTVMWVTSYLNNNDQYGSVLNVLENCLFETKSALEQVNEPIFQQHVESHIRHIQMGLHKKSFHKRPIIPPRPERKIGSPKASVVMKRPPDDEEIIINTPEMADQEPEPTETVDMIDVDEDEVEALNRSAQEYEEEKDDDETAEGEEEFIEYDEMEVEAEEEYLDDDGTVKAEDAIEEGDQSELLLGD